MYLMSAAWGSLAIALSALGATYAWFAWKRQGLQGLARGAALTMAPIGLWLTGTLRLVAVISDWAVSWATGLILSPSVILGTVLLVGSVVLFGVSGRVPRRDRRQPGLGPAAPRAATAVAQRRAPAPPDDDLDEVEALLRRRGIS